jgi:ornithine cyclodeaminase
VGHGASATHRFGAKAGVDLRTPRPGLKVGTYWPENPQAGRPAHGSLTLLLDEATGRPAALVAATHLNALRTAAADAVAVRWLARPDAGAVAVVGAGHQAWFELAAVRRMRPVTVARVWSRDRARAEAFAARCVADGLPAEAADLDAAVRGADIVITATASRTPLVARGWVRPGAHISAMGADGVGKQELDVDLVAQAACFADLPEQAARIGECQHAVAAGRLAPQAIASLGAVIVGAAEGRTGPDQITLFDSSGLGLQDIAVAEVALQRARAQGLGQWVDLAG